MLEGKSHRPEDIRSRILNLIKIRGPILPIHAARESGTSILLASAFLSDLASQRDIKISNLKVGGSPLYFLAGQEAMLEKFYTYLLGKEKEAFLLLKEKKILQDEKLEPAIRVALRSIKDFAFPLKAETNESIFWRFHDINEEEALKQVKEILKPKIQEEIKPIVKLEIKPKIEIEKKKPAEEIKRVIKEKLVEEEKPAEIKEEKKPLIKIREKRQKEKPVKFLNEVKEFLIKKDIELLQEINYDKSEVIAKVRINSDLGKIIFLLIAKDKKRVLEADLIKAYQKALNEKMPCLFLSKGDISKKTQDFIDIYKNILKTEKIT